MFLKNNKYGNILLGVFFLTMFSACFSIKPAAVKSMKKYYETFFSEGSILYFIKPQDLQGAKDNEKLQVDFSFLLTDSIDRTSAVVNFSIYSTETIKKLDRLVLKNDNMEITVTDIKLLFNEQNKKESLSRFSTEISVKALKELFANENWLFETYNAEVKRSFQPGKKTKTIYAKLNKSIFG